MIIVKPFVVGTVITLPITGSQHISISTTNIWHCGLSSTLASRLWVSKVAKANCLSSHWLSKTEPLHLADEGWWQLESRIKYEHLQDCCSVSRKWSLIGQRVVKEKWTYTDMKEASSPAQKIWERALDLKHRIRMLERLRLWSLISNAVVCGIFESFAGGLPNIYASNERIVAESTPRHHLALENAVFAGCSEIRFQRRIRICHSLSLLRKLNWIIEIFLDNLFQKIESEVAAIADELDTA